MIKSPIFILDSREKWLPCEVETIDKIPDVKGTFRANPVHLDFPDGMKQPQSARPAFYVREQGGGGMIWRQWWSWWLYNPGPPDLRGEGQHEGDWEFVQIAYLEDTPVLVTCSQHKTGGKREHWACELRDGRPVIYIALGSHANLFQPGRAGLDVCDGTGQVLDDYDELKFGAWGRFEGRWGNSTGKGKSPRSPGKQGDRISRPHVYHHNCRPA
jgi:hypothetical protein